MRALFFALAMGAAVVALACPAFGRGHSGHARTCCYVPGYTFKAKQATGAWLTVYPHWIEGTPKPRRARYSVGRSGHWPGTDPLSAHDFSVTRDPVTGLFHFN